MEQPLEPQWTNLIKTQPLRTVATTRTTTSPFDINKVRGPEGCEDHDHHHWTSEAIQKQRRAVGSRRSAHQWTNLETAKPMDQRTHSMAAGTNVPCPPLEMKKKRGEVLVESFYYYLYYFWKDIIIYTIRS